MGNDGSCDEQITKPDTAESKSLEKVPYYKLFSFADGVDYALIVIGVITSMGSGLCLPLMTFLYGELANAFGHNVGNQQLVDQVSKVRIYICYRLILRQKQCYMIFNDFCRYP